MKDKRIRALIADGDPLVCRALARLLDGVANISVVATATGAPEALRLVAQLQPAVALVDAGSARFNGLELTRDLRRLAPQTPVVVLAVYNSFGDRALAAGACRFLLKDCGSAELTQAIYLAAQNLCLSETAPSTGAIPGQSEMELK